MKKFKSFISEGAYSEDNSKNENWWNDNPMTYDWEKDLGEIKYSELYFKKIDNIFGEGHSLINNPNWPNSNILANFIPYELFKDKKILEIGCGAGLVSSHIAKSGGNITAIDLTENAIKMSKSRFQIEKLNGEILKMDAEKITFPDNHFDFIVSWGVIHHSGNMKKILDEIVRVLKPECKAYIMVYNKNSIRYQIYCRIWLGIFKLKFLNHSLNEIAGSITDGHIARHLTENEFSGMISSVSKVSFSYSDEKLTILKYLFGVAFPFKSLQIYLAKKWGWYLQAVITK